MKKRHPKVSVLMSVYNGSRYLKESVESILNQKFDDFEFIIIDDASTDQTWNILSEYAVQDNRIVLIKNHENLGLTKSLNKGLQITQGEYVARQDADDISLENRLLYQVQFLDAYPEVGAVGANAEAIDQQGQSLGVRYVLGEQKQLVEHEKLQAYLLINNCLFHSSLVARLSLIRILQGYNESLQYAQDYDLWWRLSHLARLANLPDPLISVRCSTQSITSRKRQEQLLCSFKISLKAVENSLKNQSLDREAYQKFWWTILQILDQEAYQKFWWEYRGYSGLLKLQDIQKLQPFWKLLASLSKGSQIWSPFLRKLAYDFFRNQQILEGLLLLWIILYQLETPFPFANRRSQSTYPL
ncbi:MAG: glycosyltransferase [Scytonema sp. PMC 1069.18]|nr:glycosyltransferase [Scytonema sp. PMC 1069.18]MEC4880689.1 glycosyltransferase [Scytonema sp. PMC 1070.18]